MNTMINLSNHVTAANVHQMKHAVLGKMFSDIIHLEQIEDRMCHFTYEGEEVETICFGYILDRMRYNVAQLAKIK